MQRNMPQNHGGAGAMRAVVLGQELSMRAHVVIQKQQDLATSRLGAAVTRAGRALIGLLENGKREWGCETAQCIGRPISRAIYDDEHPELAIETLLDE